ncbi:aminoglycoside 6-adenylyltransferase [Paenibacillus pasadenensis]|uniref:Putative aminoglycoside 6-adenylyltransferase n=1 Tax=Paenibacillus pasadenensis TaxID=217090 RepID=A0A2N5NAZ2_9BACL|nr:MULTISPECIES: aminoglycoside 6-adenylyltransferase [Paenibacillus]PLT47527.1 putative aminoglycoside 6-adenylyltransferase [Paenibacillus pasadenensis]QGG57764.1 aminoglycoside 6-adenylyltransferase [Paenibacillus sp. B01]
MRSETDMMELFLATAREDERIRAVTLEGSRTDPNAAPDLFQDYDISYLVSDMDSFQADPDWIDRFGSRLWLQTPEAMELFPAELGRRFSYLILFEDGNKLDLTLIPMEEASAYAAEDKLLKVLLDKDGLLPEVPPSTDEDYRVSAPSEAYFHDCRNEFWMVSTYVAKGLWRREILYAMDHLNGILRPMLLQMLEWQAGYRTGFSVSVGKNRKRIRRWLEEDEWEGLMQTFPGGSEEEVWEALFAAVRLFRRSGEQVAARLGCRYPAEEDERMAAYLRRVQSLPADAGRF